MATLPIERPVTPLRQRMLDDMAMRAMRSGTSFTRDALAGVMTHIWTSAPSLCIRLRALVKLA